MQVTPKELGQRLKAAREGRGLTQEEVAAELGLPRTSVTQMESGVRAVTGLELEKMAFLYSRSMAELVASSFEEQDAIAVLLRAEPKALQRKETQSGVRSCIALGHVLTDLERTLGITASRPPTPSYDLAPPRNKGEAVRQGTQVANEERSRLGLGAAPIGEIAELLLQNGVHVAVLELPDGVSGLTVNGTTAGTLVGVRRVEDPVRQRFSFAHEFGHVLFDRNRTGVVSKAADRDDLMEVRANAFAAAFLLPEAGTARFVEGLGKGRPSRNAMRVPDEFGAMIVAEGRSEPGSQDITLPDVVRLARHFGVSHTAAVYRLKNLGFLNESEFENLQRSCQGESTRSLALFWRIKDSCPHDPEDSIRRHLIGLGIEALRRELISQRKFHELASMVAVRREEIDAILGEAGLPIHDAPVPARIPRKRR